MGVCVCACMRVWESVRVCARVCALEACWGLKLSALSSSVCLLVVAVNEGLVLFARGAPYMRGLCAGKSSCVRACMTKRKGWRGR